MRGENKRTLHNNSIKLGRHIYVYKKIETLRNDYRFSVHRSKVEAPSLSVTPVINISEDQSIGRDATFAVDYDNS